jgi:c-di-AMP phosphodiesterase-like protein
MKKTIKKTKETMLKAEKLPASITNLKTSLTQMNIDNFTHVSSRLNNIPQLFFVSVLVNFIKLFIKKLIVVNDIILL